MHDGTPSRVDRARARLSPAVPGCLALVGGGLAMTADAAEAIAVILRDGLASLDADGAVLAVYDGDSLRVEATAGEASEVLGRGRGVPRNAPLPFAVAAHDRLPVWVRSREDAAVQFPRALDVAPRAQAWAAVPMVLDGLVIGSFGATFRSARSFCDDDRWYFAALGGLASGWCGSHLAPARRTGAGSDEPGTEPAAALLERLALVSRALTGGVPPLEVIEIVLQQAMAATGAEGGTVVLVDRQRAVTPAFTVGYAADTLPNVGPLTLDRLLPLTRAALTGEPVWVESLADALRRFPALADAHTPSRAWAAVPLLDHGDAFAVLGLSFTGPHVFVPNERVFLDALSQMAALRLAM